MVQFAVVQACAMAAEAARKLFTFPFQRLFMGQLPAGVTMMQQAWGIGLRVIRVAHAPLLISALKHLVQGPIQLQVGLPVDVHMAEQIGLSLLRNSRRARIGFHVGVPKHFLVFMPYTFQCIDKARRLDDPGAHCKAGNHARVDGQ
ncbi:hypothetical protein D3C72_1719250 [compost metagenome]